MINNLIKIGRSYSDKFTREYNLGVEHGIDVKFEKDYLTWLSKIGKFVENTLTKKFPNISSQILEMVNRKSIYSIDYSIIMSYLERAKQFGY
ncbi:MULTISPECIES: hypothetical protein [Clostridium]|uniref:Uncharacterized protein n=1 Tax=Clostridium novyi (strain NT) TaxID=386415 RepID=A0Q0G1_CLONN|nr:MULTISPECIES: hypothetical protein [Clostridium]ABK61911.1 hypothetical protein NT01CX_2040 [Clostridium novyi NT]KEH85085.1 hypothetical protein Z966_08920 [Clostridium novyi A str. NCTC 538]KEH85466.1 hypothetical protein Z965_09795 [Clostridium novyi A str. BKT29909]KEH86470.1 hypothetical protein Z967_05795 [Clostridium novyi A str. 4540]KEH90575.1 hypothetical protein Z963_11675 [Clostridium botulinum C/D str. It1]